MASSVLNKVTVFLSRAFSHFSASVYLSVFITTFTFSSSGFLLVNIGEAALPAGFLRLKEGAAEITGVERSRSAIKGQVMRLELGDQLMTSDKVDGAFYFFDGSVFSPSERLTYKIEEEGLFLAIENNWRIVHGFLVPLTSRKINTDIPRGRQPGATWASNSALSIIEEKPITSGKIANGEVMRTGTGTIIKINGGERGTVLLSANSDLRLLPQGYGLEQGSGMFHLGPDSTFKLYTDYLVIEAQDAFVEVMSQGKGLTAKVLRGRVEVFDNKLNKKLILRGGQMCSSSQFKLEQYGEKSVLYSVAEDFISRMNEKGLDGFSAQFQQSLAGQNQMSTVAPVEGPSLPSSGNGSLLPPSSNADSQVSLPAPAVSQFPPLGQAASPVPPSPYKGDSTKAEKVPVAIDKKASSSLNPLNKSIPGDSPSDWYESK